MSGSGTEGGGWLCGKGRSSLAKVLRLMVETSDRKGKGYFQGSRTGGPCSRAVRWWRKKQLPVLESCPMVIG